MTVYNIKNQWGGTSAPWHQGGTFNIGNRTDQRPVELEIVSGDGGNSFTGTMTYDGEGPIGVRASLVTNNCYHAQNQWGGNDAPWNDAGMFLLGSRVNQKAVAINLHSDDQGETMGGTMTYAGEGPIGVQASQSSGSAYYAKNQWGGGSGEWHPGGQWVLGCRAGEQSVESIEVMSDDGGETLYGTMTYSGEGPIAFRGTRIMADTYSVANQWGGDDAPWHPGGTWVIGCRAQQGVIDLRAGGEASLNGEMTYAGEGPIGLELELS